MFLYENHLGGLYGSDYELNPDELYCDECGGSDCLIGEFNTFKEVRSAIQEEYGLVDDYACHNCRKKKAFNEDDCEFCDIGHGYYISIVASDIYQWFDDMDKEINYQIQYPDGDIEDVKTTTLFGSLDLPPCSPTYVDSEELAKTMAYHVFRDYNRKLSMNGEGIGFVPERIKVEQTPNGFLCTYFFTK